MYNSSELFLYLGHIIHLPSNVPAPVYLMVQSLPLCWNQLENQKKKKHSVWHDQDLTARWCYCYAAV